MKKWTCPLGICLALWLCALGTPAQARLAKFVKDTGTVVSADLATTATADCMIQGLATTASPTNSDVPVEEANWGASNQLDMGRFFTQLRRSLLRFDFTQLAGQYRTLTHARLILTVHRFQMGGATTTPPSSLTLELHRLTRANAGWVEGVSATGQPCPGAACWAWRSTRNQSWTGAKGCSLAGVDYEEQPVGVIKANNDFWYDGDQLVFEIDDPAFLDAWIRDPAANAGFLLRSRVMEDQLDANSEGLFTFYSGEAAAANLRPRFELEYEPLETSTTQEVIQPGMPIGSPDNPAMMATSLCSGREGSYGKADRVRVGYEPVTASKSQAWCGLLKFDLTGLRGRVGQLIAARLKLTMRDVVLPADQLDKGQQFQLYRLTPANAAWQEGGGLNGEAEDGAASWGWLALNRQRWAGAPAQAGVGQPGVDYETTPVALATISSTTLHDGATLTLEFTDPAFLSEWIESPTRNAGFKLVSPSLTDSGKLTPDAAAWVSIDSDDAPELTRRPRLELDFTTAHSKADPAWAQLP